MTTDPRPEWARQPYPFRLAHTWAKKTLIQRMRELHIQPDVSRSRESLLKDLALAVKERTPKQG